MSEIKRITIPVNSELKDRLELIAKGQRRSLSANLEHALEVYAALFDEQGKMLVPIDSILMGDLSCLRNVTSTVQIKNEQINDQSDECKVVAEVNEPKVLVQAETKTAEQKAEEESVLGTSKTKANKGKFGKK